MKSLFSLLLLFSLLPLSETIGQSSSKKLQVNATLMIHDGQMDNFKEIAKKCIKSTKEKDTGTLQYDWFLDEAASICVVRETYESSEAILEHMGNLGELLDQLLATAALKVEVFGEPSAELVAATEGMDITVYSYFGGLD